MNRKIKALGLALVAALALTAVMASTASAQFTSATAHTILSGAQEGNHVFTAGEGFGSIKCTTASFSGTTTSTNETDQTITPTYTGCTDSFGRTVHVHTTVKYTFTKTGTVEGTPIGVVHLVSPGSITITVTSGGSTVCTVHITVPQTQTGITYHTLESGGVKFVRVTTKATGVKSTTTGNFFNCGISEGAHSEGTYTGTTNMTGKDTAGNPVSISVS
jgi:hypothetical protein